MKKLLAVLLSVLMLLSFAACGQKETATTAETAQTATETAQTKAVAKTGLWKDALYLEDTSIGTGKKEVKVTVQAEDQSIVFTLHTDLDTLADALLEAKIVEGDDTEFGLYIKTVNGILADYNVDQSFWSLCQNGEMMMTGASSTPVAGGEAFELIYTKG